MKTFITSDWHIGHKNIIKLCGRPFPDIETHDHELIERHNSVVEECDTVYDLGDFAFRCSSEYAVSVLEKLNGRRILLWGNHDKPLRKALSKGLLQPLLNSGKVKFIGSSNWRELTGYIFKHMGRKIVISHYAYRSWPGAFRNTLHFYGHSHSNLPSLYKSMDCGVDNNDFYPFFLDDVIECLENIEDEFKEI